MNAKTKNFYIVEVKYPEGDWQIHFTDYDKETAYDEARDEREANDRREPGDYVQVRVRTEKVPFDQYLRDCGEVEWVNSLSKSNCGE